MAKHKLRRVPSLAECWEKYYYKRGLAICEARIITDTIFFKFRDETYDIPSRNACDIQVNTMSDYFYAMNHAPIAKVRALAKKLGIKHG